MLDITLKDIYAFFEMTLSEFSKDWKLLSDSDKAAIKGGLADGTLNY